MAYLIRLKGNYYARVRTSERGKIKDRFVPLHTASGRRANILFPKIQEREILWKQKTITFDQIGKIDFPEIEVLIDDYFGDCERRGLDSRTLDLYKYGLKLFREFFDGRDLETLTDKDGTRFIDFLRSEYKSNHSANIHIRTVNHFLNFLFANKKIAAIPFRLNQFDVGAKSPHYFSNAEMNEIFKAVKDNKELATRIFVHYNTGLRLRELGRSELHGKRIEVYAPCKNGAVHYIPVSENVATAYRWLKENSQYNPATISRFFKETLEALKLYKLPSGETRHFHNLRDTFGTLAYWLTRDIFAVAKWMGHINKKSGVPNVNTTAIYANAFDIEQLTEDFSEYPGVLTEIRSALLRNYRANYLDTAQAKSDLFKIPEKENKKVKVKNAISPTGGVNSGVYQAGIPIDDRE
ncbi:MAG: site-specific integrase [Candidatus Neomarinimicrobiota bacterium]